MARPGLVGVQGACACAGEVMSFDQWLTFIAAIAGGALRVGAPFLFVSLGECLTEKAGRINLGLEGVLVLSAVAAFGGSYWSGSAWIGVIAAALAGGILAALHGLLCNLARVNDIATGIALMLLGTGLAFYLGKPLIQPQAPQLPAIDLGAWSSSSAVRAALQVNVLVPLGFALAAIMTWALANTRVGLILRLAGDSADAARAQGFSLNLIRVTATTIGGMIAGLGGACLTLFYPGSWNEGISSGQGLIAVALVIFARWSPWRCVAAALLFGGAGAIGPALQSIGFGWGYHLFNIIPYVLTLIILVLTCRPGSVAHGSPGELGAVRS
jgi:general nucleoside transport system permease protein